MSLLFNKLSLKVQFFSFLLFFSISSPLSTANNIQVSNVSLTGQSIQDHYSYIQFDVSWENSWRTSLAPNNWDAAWIFVKYRINGGDGLWRHAYIDINGCLSPAGSIINPANDGTGAFIYRSNDGDGTFSVSGVKLKWNYSNSIKNDIGPLYVQDNDLVELKVFAIEMVYVPQGSFYLGSGSSRVGREESPIYQYPNITTPYNVLSEQAIDVGTTSGNLYYDFIEWTNGDQLGPIPHLFPKGYKAFYCMKYELCQQQYIDFLNCLTQTQADLRKYDTNLARYAIVGDVVGSFSTANPYVAINWLSFGDLGAYLDWAALRPMTELEYEKACRGPVYPFPNEYAFGNRDVIQSIGISNPGQIDEVSSNAANCCFDSGVNSPIGPMRIGCFATASTNRIQSGASYYGIMEMSGNVWERPVTIGNPEGRSFIGNHGDGLLDGTGNYNVPTWPNPITEIGAGFRGGHWNNNSGRLQVSDRTSAATRPGLVPNYDVHDQDFGGRGVRTAQ